jgi:hypothetical protein
LPKPVEFEGIKKQEQMPLEDEIKLVEAGGIAEAFYRIIDGEKIKEWSYRNPNAEIATVLRYLRDEIQKLKQQ